MFVRVKWFVFLSVCVVSLSLLLNPLIHAKTHQHDKPLIGILLNDGGKGGYSEYPWYAMRQNYSQVIAENGGIPVFIGHDVEALDGYLKVLDGIVFTGGDFASPPEAYSTGIAKDYKPKAHSREDVEFTLIKQSYKNDVPVLGICAGMQQMNIVMGGTIYENLKKSLNTPIQHRNETRHKVVHTVEIQPTSKLYQIMQKERIEVNSNHNAGINKVATNMTVTSHAPDGVIESFEDKDKRFFVGIMWHPEFVLSAEEKKLWQAFVNAAKENHLKKS